jgi:drug/metabolite transporter (DMT)-like permease
MIDPNSNSFWRLKQGAPSNLKYKILLLLSIIVGSCGQLLMKMGTKSLGGISFKEGLAPGLIHIFTCPYIIGGLICVGVGMLFWLSVISKLELSFAYPVVALSYILILIFGRFIFSEHITTARICGIACIMLGVILISRTENSGRDAGTGSGK